jgi:hemerythrin-like domain-containing protein
MEVAVRMEKNAATVLAELREDHKNMALMLKLLEREANRIYDGDEPDYELLQDIMHYMTVYPDAVHHPKEDRLYAELRSYRPDLSTGFERITMDHRHIAELSLKLRDDIAAINSGNPVRRRAVVADALRYVNTLRGHMQWEELDLFRRVDEMIRLGHDMFDPENYVNVSDPVFGMETEEDFGRLVECIRAEAAAS